MPAGQPLPPPERRAASCRGGPCPSLPGAPRGFGPCRRARATSEPDRTGPHCTATRRLRDARFLRRLFTPGAKSASALVVPELERERDGEEPDRPQRRQKSLLTELEARVARRGRRPGLGERLTRGRRGLVERPKIERVDPGPRLHQRLVELANRARDRLGVEPALRKFFLVRRNLFASRAQFVERGAELRRRRVALRILLRVLGVAVVAEVSRLVADHLVGRLHDVVLAVALAALRPLVLLERRLVAASVEELAVDHVAAPADLRDARDRRRHGGVASVAAGAGGRAHVSLFEQRLPVNAALVLRDLVRRHRLAGVGLEAGHVLGARVA